MKSKDLAGLFSSALLCLACGASDSVENFPVTGPQIELRYVPGFFTFTAQQQSVVAAAVDKWTRAVSKNLGVFRLDGPANDCFPGRPQLNENHPNLLVFVTLADIDGPSQPRLHAGMQH